MNIQVIHQAFSGSYFNLKFSGTGTTSGSSSGTITIQGNLENLSGGTLNFTSRPVTITGTQSSQSIDGFSTTGTVSCTKTTGIATFTGDVSGGHYRAGAGTLHLGTGLTHTQVLKR